MGLAGTILDAASVSAAEALDRVRLGELRSLEEVEEYVEARLGSILDMLMPSAKAELATLVAPATQQAVDAIKPAMYEALRDWTPSIAAIVGGMAGLAVLLGVWVSKRTFTRTRRNPHRRAA